MSNSQNNFNIVIRNETPADAVEVEQLGAAAFGPGRFTRSAFRLREGVAPDLGLCFIAELNGVVVGSVRLTEIMIGKDVALVLGPLVISDKTRSLGIGRELMNRSLFNAKKAGHQFVVLVGDLAYYKKFGFKKVPYGKIKFPGPADPDRILCIELVEGAGNTIEGTTKRKL